MIERIGFIGAGNMASALVAGLVHADEAGAPVDRALASKPMVVRCADVDETRRDAMAQEYGVFVTESNDEVVSWAEVVVLAVKPQAVSEVLRQCGQAFKDGQLVVSVCAGISLDFLNSRLKPDVRLVRAMPNTPALIGAGATAIAPAPGVSSEQLKWCQRLFAAVGICRVVPERLMDAITGLSGSGPAYVLMAIEALAEGGVRAGVPRAEALELATQTFLGAAQLVQESGEHPAVLKDRVTSPGGTTAAGLHALEQGGLRAALINAVAAATDRSKELGHEA